MFSTVEIIGYLGSILVALSLMMSSVVRLRWINLAGATIFSVYGLLVGAYPVMVVNGFIAIVDIWFLVRMARESEYFSLLEIPRTDNMYLLRFLEFHGTDIASFFPGFELEKIESPQVVFILRDMNPAGLVVFSENDTEVRIHLDYVIPSYRDLRCGRFFIQQRAEKWRDKGILNILSRATGRPHSKYLRRLGFQPTGKSKSVWYERSLASVTS